jgi:hypothetical protein
VLPEGRKVLEVGAERPGGDVFHSDSPCICSLGLDCTIISFYNNLLDYWRREVDREGAKVIAGADHVARGD